MRIRAGCPSAFASTANSCSSLPRGCGAFLRRGAQDSGTQGRRLIVKRRYIFRVAVNLGQQRPHQSPRSISDGGYNKFSSLFPSANAYDPAVHPHASLYARVAIAAWSASTPAGSASAALSAVRAQRSHLGLDPNWGWMGTCSIAMDWPSHIATLANAVMPQQPGRLALGIGSSKGNLVAVDRQLRAHWNHQCGSNDSPLAVAPGDVTALTARSLRLNSYLPCATAAACSTGLACLLAGADLLERGQADTALVGAAEQTPTPWLMAGFSNSGVLCVQTPPQAFAQATGFAPSSGAAIIALSTQLHQHPYRLCAGVRLGDAGHETHFTDPNTLHTALAALWDVAPRPDLIVCHATGTAHGDAYERAGLDAGPWSQVPRLCCKPWLGHSLGASAAVELAVGLETGLRRLWKMSLGFGGHLVAVAIERQ